ncbi:PIN domain-containing protein [Streptantibioticus ferralitis]|uniref:PIN domain-containing protein n=1 Tax=Streptantibioticus ferralitis TaxID=236510 RepID=A0ABT5Z4H2_9ACTN|nr:PIN domain-containing protein [Streptantibioticus ferralitis]MDF2258727.1 PIN domain-containing protein [Streptantibioticus ferralitis]
MTFEPLVVVDAANTVGAVPDGWWRDRHGATERLRDAIAPLAEQGLPDRDDVPEWARRPPLDVVLVVEGAARDVPAVPGVRVVSAPRSGDDRIVELLAEAARETPDRPLLLITADRALRERAAAHGAESAGPRAVRS